MSINCRSLSVYQLACLTYPISVSNYKNGNTSKSQLVSIKHQKLAVFSKNANNGILPYVHAMLNLIPFCICVICERVGVLKNQFLPFTIYPFISETHSENTSPAFFPVFAEHTSSYLYFASYFPDVTS